MEEALNLSSDRLLDDDEAILALSVKLEPDAHDSDSLHTLTCMKLKYGLTLLRYFAIMIPVTEKF